MKYPSGGSSKAAKALFSLTLVSSFLLSSITPSGYSANQTLSSTLPGKMISSSSRSGSPSYSGQTIRALVGNHLGKLPLSFEINQGQADRRVKFLSRGAGYNLFLTSSGAELSLSKSAAQIHRVGLNDEPKSAKKKTSKDSSAVIQMKLAGVNARARIEGLEPLSGKVNYFNGKDPGEWRTNISTFARVKYHDVYPGVDMAYYGKQGQLEYDFLVAAGADPNRIRLEFKGADRLELDSQGNLILHTSAGELRQHKPLIYQEIDGTRRQVTGSFIIKGQNKVGFQIGDYDTTRPLVIDPSIVYSTFLGGGFLPDGQYFGRVQADSVAVYTDSSSGNTYAYVVGNTEADGFPTKNALQTTGRTFVAKLNMAASGEASLVYSTFIGKYAGTSIDFDPVSIAVDSAGNAYITGNVQTNDFPVVNAFQTTNNGPYPGDVGCSLCRYGDAFIMKLNPNGNGIIYSTYLGGSGSDVTNGIALDSAGNAYVTGYTSSANLPVVNAYQNINRNSRLSQGGSNAFVSKIAPPSAGNPASLVYSTYLGGSGSPGCSFQFDPSGDFGNSIAVDSAGNAYITGDLCSSNFPLTSNAFKTTGSGFMAKLNPSASGAASLVYSTALGSVQARGVAVDSAGNAYVTGVAYTNDFVTTPGAFQPQIQQDDSGFVMKLDPTKAGAASLVYSTYLGGTKVPGAPSDGQFFGGGPQSISVDAAGDAFITGTTASPHFPLVNPVQPYSSGVFESIDGGNSFTGLSNGLTGLSVNTLAVDTSTVPRTIYAGTPDGVYKSTDGGTNWKSASNGLAVTDPNTGIVYKDIYSLAIIPQTPSTIYAGGGAGIFKSTDGGNNWIPFYDGQSDAAVLNTLSLDTTTTNGGTVNTIYAGTADGLYKITDGASSWTRAGLDATPVQTIAIDTKTSPHTLYIGTNGYGGYGAYKSADRGNTWTPISFGYYGGPLAIAVDSQTTPSTLYGIDEESAEFGNYPLWKSFDGGDTWNLVTSGKPDMFWRAEFRPPPLLIDDRTTPSTIYTGSSFGGLAVSTDGGLSWTQVFRQGVGAMALDSSSVTPSPLYIGTSRGNYEAFVAELNPTGSALLFSTYLGGYNDDFAKSIAVDSTGNIYVAGFTQSNNFPAINAYQSTLHGNYSAFVTKLGSAVLPSSSTSSVTTQVATQTGTLAITFPDITGSTTGTQPTMTVTPLDSTATANFSLSNNLGAYEISTTATTSASASQPITLCFQVLSINDPTTFSDLRVIHVVNGVPVDATSSRDFNTRTVCASVTSFSPFIIVKGPTDQIKDLVKLVKSFNLQNGIANSLDKKLQNAEDALAAAKSGYRLSACNSIASFTNEVQAQMGKALTQEQANQLMTAGRSIKFALGCQ